MSATEIRILPLADMPEVVPGDSVAKMIVRAISSSRISCVQGDIFVIAQKIVSKAEGSIVHLSEVMPSERAREWAGEMQKDPRLMEVILGETIRVVRRERGVLIVETRQGLICANAGVDVSNAPEGAVILLPRDPDNSARELKVHLDAALGVQVGIIISDTFGRPWREGLVNVAIGIAGVAPLRDYRGSEDSFGRKLQASVLAVADELASAAELVMGKTSRVPAALIRGYSACDAGGSARDLIRPPEHDLFR